MMYAVKYQMGKQGVGDKHYLEAESVADAFTKTRQYFINLFNEQIIKEMPLTLISAIPFVDGKPGIHEKTAKEKK